MTKIEHKTRKNLNYKYQLRCDCCGKFVKQGEPGGSFVMIPGTDWNSEDERERCPACTNKYGQAYCGDEYIKQLCCGMNPRK